MIIIIIPVTPNSIPLNGKNAINPPRPRILSRPNAQDGHDGAIRLTMMLEIPTPLPFICRFIKKILIEITIPAKTDIISNITNEAAVIVFVVLPSRDKKRRRENSWISNL